MLAKVCFFHPYSIHMAATFTLDCGSSINFKFCFTLKCTWNFVSSFLALKLTLMRQRNGSWKTEFIENTVWMHLVTLKPKTKVVLWRTASDLLLPTDFMKMNRKKVQIFLTIGECKLDFLDLYPTDQVLAEESWLHNLVFKPENHYRGIQYTKHIQQWCINPSVYKQLIH